MDEIYVELVAVPERNPKKCQRSWQIPSWKRNQNTSISVDDLEVSQKKFQIFHGCNSISIKFHTKIVRTPLSTLKSPFQLFPYFQDCPQARSHFFFLVLQEFLTFRNSLKISFFWWILGGKCSHLFHIKSPRLPKSDVIKSKYSHHNGIRQLHAIHKEYSAIPNRSFFGNSSSHKTSNFHSQLPAGN